MLNLDASNPTLAAVQRGVIAESTGEAEASRAAYTAAWEAAADDFERCIAAHYVPRLIDAPAEKLRWNEEALRLADAVGDERVVGFYASLYANVGQCRLDIGDPAGARLAFETASQRLVHVPAGAYKDALTAMIETGLAELAPS